MPRATKQPKRAVTPAAKVRLIQEVSRQVYDATESFHGKVGGDLAYLLAAIAEDSRCDWYGGEEIICTLKQAFPSRRHAVWRYIKWLQRDEPEQAAGASIPTNESAEAGKSRERHVYVPVCVVVKVGKVTAAYVDPEAVAADQVWDVAEDEWFNPEPGEHDEPERVVEEALKRAGWRSGSSQLAGGGPTTWPDIRAQRAIRRGGG